MSHLILHPAKSLTEPLFVFLVVALVALSIAWRRTARGRRGPIAIALVAVICLWIASTATLAYALEWTLVLPDEPVRVEPAAIIVPSGGASTGDHSDLDILTTYSEARVVAAVSWWREHPHAKLIMAGADATVGGKSSRALELMHDEAVRRGVPEDAIMMDRWSLNTREHPLGILRLPGITPATPLGLVTSPWHMRRALHEFRRHFANVTPHAPPLSGSSPPVLNDLLPDANALRASTLFVQEWIGMAWYRARALFD